MRNQRVNSNLDRITGLFNKYDILPDDYEIKAHWSKYLCISVAGFIETSIIELFSEFVKTRTDLKVYNYSSNQLSKLQNMKMTKIIALLSVFDSEWGETLTKETEGELKDSIDSIFANRHNLAHGGNVGVGFVNLKNWYKNTIEVIRKIETLLNPP